MAIYEFARGSIITQMVILAIAMMPTIAEAQGQDLRFKQLGAVGDREYYWSERLARKTDFNPSAEWDLSMFEVWKLKKPLSWKIGERPAQIYAFAFGRMYSCTNFSFKTKSSLVITSPDVLSRDANANNISLPPTHPYAAGTVSEQSPLRRLLADLCENLPLNKGT